MHCVIVAALAAETASRAIPYPPHAPALASPPTTQPAPPDAPATQDDRETVTIAGEKFRLELAVNDVERAQGLMERTEIEADGGMLFIYPEPDVLEFWMADCVIDIDALFVDAAGTIVATHAMKTEPPQRETERRAAYEARLKRYSSKQPAHFAIELKAGTIERLKINAGQKVEMDAGRLGKLGED